MGNVVYKKGSLFDAPEGSILCHSVNCQGVWGSGIAKQFKEKFPEAFKSYNYVADVSLLGSTFLITDDKYTVGCLFTSKNYGKLVDPPDLILKSTELAILDLVNMNDENLPIHMCKINSGLFNVPWEQTEEILKKHKDVLFTVWDF